MSVSHAVASPLSRERERVGVRARALRANSTDAEKSLWQRLRSRQIGGYKFRRQHPVGSYFADFACVEAQLIIELDGGQHVLPHNQSHDLTRTRALTDAGFQVLRFWNNDVLTPTEAVLQLILDALANRCPHPNPLPQGEGKDRLARPIPIPTIHNGISP